MDLGFLNTYDQYYNGEEGIVGAVKVIDAIIEGLKDHPYRKYIYKLINIYEQHVLYLHSLAIDSCWPRWHSFKDGGMLKMKQLKTS